MIIPAYDLRRLYPQFGDDTDCFFHGVMQAGHLYVPLIINLTHEKTKDRERLLAEAFERMCLVLTHGSIHAHRLTEGIAEALNRGQDPSNIGALVQSAASGLKILHP